jgi:membrane-associated phospholipid phosphatase
MGMGLFQAIGTILEKEKNRSLCNKHVSTGGLLKSISLALDKLAFVVSEIAIPPVFSAAVFMIFCYRLVAPFSRAVMLLGLCILFSAIIPIVHVLFLMMRGKIAHHHMPDKAQRTGPYLVGAASFFVGFLVLYLMAAPPAVWALMFASSINTLVITIINLKWKISGHTIAVACSAAALQAVFGWTIWMLHPAIIIVAWARVKVGAHNLPQVVAGAVLGFIFTFTQLICLIKLL